MFARALQLVTAASLALSAAACVSHSSTPMTGRVEVPLADKRIGQYISSGWSFDTSSFWIEGPEGVVVIDVQFLPSIAAEVIAAAERVTRKKVVAAIVLHPNPDKFNGTATFQARGIEVWTSEQVLGLIPEVFARRSEVFAERYAPDWPTATPQPRSFGAATTTLKLAGLELKAHVLGPGCSAAHVVIEWEDHVFVGDLVANKAHAWLDLGETAGWLQRLTEIEAMGARSVHPGRGRSGGAELVTNQREYLQTVVSLVAAEKPTMPPEPAAIQRVRAELERRYQDYRFPVFLETAVPAVWRQLAAETAAEGPEEAPAEAPPESQPTAQP
ncbi:MBL fold metallo-hydrolase [Nannocystis bainbridge]|uniref:MBL fold metallo-hydrolase n=1 Tax=Nannocystis bainbridge TaxID=2995303 RepID=A0ABT5DZJ7_9BACT|nr:MBL fold metallo-hydrolase [Nannocystis bainbridge]MDC0719052.1 MBL fold metallo-hydrolase [Nannocystis bainbridge]